MGSVGFVKFEKKGFHGDRLKMLGSDAVRWRWWRLYCLSDDEVFPGLVAKGGITPLTEMSIVGEVYETEEFRGAEKIEAWRSEKKLLAEVGLIKIAQVNSHEYIWNVDFHSFQDKWSKKGARLKDKFYSAFLDLNERDKTIFIVLLSTFAPRDVDLSVFSIPRHIEQFSAYANKQLPLFSKGNGDTGSIKGLLAKVSDDVRDFEVERKTERGNPDVKSFVEWYCEKFKEQTKRPYSVGGKDFKLVAEMLKLFSPEELKKLAERFFREPDQYVKRAGFTIGIFKMMLNRLVSVSERKPIGLDDYSKYRV